MKHFIISFGPAGSGKGFLIPKIKEILQCLYDKSNFTNCTII